MNNVEEDNIDKINSKIHALNKIKDKFNSIINDELRVLNNKLLLLQEDETDVTVREWIQRGKAGLNKNIDDNDIPKVIKNDYERLRRKYRDECPFPITDFEACRDCKDTCWNKARQIWKEKYNF